ncbi:MAG: hypothetical protein DRH26_11265 [Deltaproteobacteria bacterium]|nr:MAG: hypothetical protein DRH26_11265 [Deltaproteobacteria bacterium]
MFNRKAKILIPGFNITDLRINFKIEKSLVGYPNLGNIKIYNLSESSRNNIEAKGLKLQLFAGYEDVSVPLLFTGDIINVVHLKTGPDWISEVFAADGVNILSTATINKTLPAGMDTAQIYNELVSQMKGITKGATEGLKNFLSGKRSLLRELQLSGNIKDWLDKLAMDCGFEYSVNDEVIETTPSGYPLSDVPPVVINQKTGMIGSPERTEIGINVSHLLLPELKLARTIRVESISAKLNVGNLFYRKIPPIRNKGIYRIDKLIHTGDTHDNPWTTQISARVF